MKSKRKLSASAPSNYTSPEPVCTRCPTASTISDLLIFYILQLMPENKQVVSPRAGPSRTSIGFSVVEKPSGDEQESSHERDVTDNEDGEENGEGEDSEDEDGFVDGMDPEGYANEKALKPLTPEALAAFKAAQHQAGIIYISRIPPGMRPTKVRHLMSAFGAVGRVYLQQEGEFCHFYLEKKGLIVLFLQMLREPISGRNLLPPKRRTIPRAGWNSKTRKLPAVSRRC